MRELTYRTKQFWRRGFLGHALSTVFDVVMVHNSSVYEN